MSPTDPTKEPLESMAERNAHVMELMDRLRASSPIYKFILPTMTLTSAIKGHVATRLILGPEHLNSRGGLHGAVTATIVDFTTGLAIASWDLRPATGASVDMNISYLNVAEEGDVLFVDSTAEKVGGSLSFVRVKISKMEEDGENPIVALAQHTKYLRPKPKTEA
ncbi:thioesterase superfamily protein [Sarocladium implicatum]|nr:thioesterase superfamily protein [Sarocladium implicatum]